MTAELRQGEAPRRERVARSHRRGVRGPSPGKFSDFKTRRRVFLASENKTHGFCLAEKSFFHAQFLFLFSYMPVYNTPLPRRGVRGSSPGKFSDFKTRRCVFLASENKTHGFRLAGIVNSCTLNMQRQNCRVARSHRRGASPGKFSDFKTRRRVFLASENKTHGFCLAEKSFFHAQFLFLFSYMSVYNMPLHRGSGKFSDFKTRRCVFLGSEYKTHGFCGLAWTPPI